MQKMIEDFISAVTRGAGQESVPLSPKLFQAALSPGCCFATAAPTDGAPWMP